MTMISAGLLTAGLTGLLASFVWSLLALGRGTPPPGRAAVSFKTALEEAVGRSEGGTAAAGVSTSASAPAPKHAREEAASRSAVPAAAFAASAPAAPRPVPALASMKAAAVPPPASAFPSTDARATGLRGRTGPSSVPPRSRARCSILESAAQGRTAAQIARSLGIGVGEVELTLRLYARD